MSVDHINSLTHPYRQLLEENKTVVRWRLFSSSSQESTVGFVKKNVADIYNPASQKNSVGLSYAIEFDDSAIAYGSINPTQANPHDMLDLARSTAIASEESLMLPPTPDQTRFPRLIAESGYKEDILSDLLPRATELRELLLSQDMKAIEGALDANYSEDSFHDSNGLSLYEESALYGAIYELDGRLYTVHNSRTYPESFEAVRDRVPQLTAFAKALSQDMVTPDVKRLPVFVPGGIAIINTYLIEHLGGTSVAAGSSLYKQEDFKNHLQVAHDSFTLSFDQTKNMERSSFAFTPEGIAGQHYDLIKNGRLVEPICGLKSAQRLGYTPRVASSAASALLTDLPDFEKLRSEVGTFLIAFSLMGLHSQNNMTGDYSIPCPDSLYFENGELVGPVRAVITGNFFDVLKSGQMQFVQSSLAQSPVLLFDTDVTFSN